MIKVEIKGLEATLAMLRGQEKQVRFAAAKSLTRVAYAVRDATVKEMQAKLDNPTTYTTKQAIQVEAARKDLLAARVGLGIRVHAPSKGTHYDRALGHLFTGGTRARKKMESAFMRIGVLPPGWMMVPGKACPLDAHGNPSRGFIVQLIAYFNAFGEQGYKANMTDKRRSRMARAGKTESGFRTINGVAYFISRGKGNWFGRSSWMHGRVQHLPPGIWAKTGIHGVDVKPIFMFVRSGRWSQRIDLPRIAGEVVAREWPRTFATEMAAAMRTAR